MLFSGVPDGYWGTELRPSFLCCSCFLDGGISTFINENFEQSNKNSNIYDKDFFFPQITQLIIISHYI